MVKNHLKRLNAPKTWKIKRKGIKFVTKPNPNRSMKEGLPLNIIIRDILGYAKTTEEVKRILSENNVLIDGVRRKDHRFCVGFMDTIKFIETKKSFRVIINKKGKIDLIKIEENDANIKLSRLINKNKIKGKTQLNLFDGKNILVEKDNYKTGDTLVLSIPKQEIKTCLKLERGSLIYLTGGSHIGEICTVEDILGNKIRYKIKKGDIFETLKEYAFVIGKDKPIIKVE